MVRRRRRTPEEIQNYLQQVESLAEELEELTPGWGKLCRTDKQKLMEEIDKELRYLESPD